MDTLIPEDACLLCRTLVQEEGYGPLLKLGLKRGIEPHVMVNICDAAADLSQFLHEGRHVSTAMLIGKKKVFEQSLYPSPLDLQGEYAIKGNSFRRELRALAGLVDGHHLALVLNNKGRILGIKRISRNALGTLYDEVSDGINSLYPGYLRHMAIISKMSDCLAFYVPPEGNAVKTYETGTMVAQYIMGDWQATDYRAFFDGVLSVAKGLYLHQGLTAPFDESDYLTCLVKLMRVATLMSTRNMGTIFSLDLKLKGARRKRTKLTELLDLSSKDVSVTDMEDEEILNLASLDGAVLIDGKGRLVEFNAILDTDMTLSGEWGQGSRHETAINYSASRDNAIVIVVSQDGGITAFCRGNKIAAVPVIQN